MNTPPKVRIDKYLWAIRIFKTRSMAAAACDGGKVKLHGEPIKASKSVVIGETYIVQKEKQKLHLLVKSIIDNRGPYLEAIKHYEDVTPEEEKVTNDFQATSFYTGKRLSKVGRPTKQQRRDLDDFMKE
jgi:Ribosome-associated heat shock protein implicated in the recycling of the 50S subunit (S4 paralog)